MFILVIEGRPARTTTRSDMQASSLELGSSLGWLQRANFLVAGLFTLVFALGLPGALRERGPRFVLGPLLNRRMGLGTDRGGRLPRRPGQWLSARYT